MRPSLFLTKMSILILMVTQLLYALDLNDIDIAIIWNVHTSNTSAPIGWEVGDPETGSAPEIAHAQMKHLLSTFSDEIDAPSSPLDTVGIPRSLTNGNGIPDGEYEGELESVRIYCWDDAPLSLDQIKSDFNGNKPSAIIYINGGAEWGTDKDGSDGGLYQTLIEAANDDIGIMTIGDASATDAKNIDTTKTVFPVMGVQKNFRFKAFGGDEIREFNFLTENDEIENGTTIWEIADTVILHSDVKEAEGDSRYWITLSKDVDTLSAGTKIYECKGTSSGADPSTPTINEISASNVEILHAYGEWSIKARAVEVIDIDLYSPEMADGIYNNHDVILVSRTNTNSVFVSEAEWGSKLWVNGSPLVDRGEELPNVKDFGEMKSGKFVFDKDYIVEAANIDDPSKMDSILIVKSGTKIPTGGAAEDAHYLDTYLAGGYTDLQIKLTNTNSKIFGEVFPSLEGVKSIDYLPWTKNGRIQADADIWAINEQLNPLSFDRITSGFDRDAYYCTYFGDQVAGAKNNPHFVEPPINRDQFDSTADKMRLDFAGVDDGSDTVKLYHAISAMQNGHRRLVMLGFQPTYLDNTESVVSDLLEDATKWIAIDDYLLPTPTITPIYDDEEMSPSDTHYVYTDIDSFRVDVDFTKKGTTLNSSEFEIHVTVEYDNGEKDFDVVSIEADSRASDSVETYTYKLSDEITIDPTDSDNPIINITAQAVPVGNNAQFDKSYVGKTTYSIYQLEKPEFKNDNGEFPGKEFIKTDEVSTDKATSATGASSVDDVTITCTFSGDATGTESGTSPFEYDLVEKSFEVSAVASKDKYLDSKAETREYERIYTDTDQLDGEVRVSDGDKEYTTDDAIPTTITEIRIILDIEGRSPEIYDSEITVSNIVVSQGDEIISSSLNFKRDDSSTEDEVILVATIPTNSISSTGSTVFSVTDIEIESALKDSEGNEIVSHLSDTEFDFQKLEIDIPSDTTAFTTDTIVVVSVNEPGTEITVDGEVISDNTFTVTSDTTVQIVTTKEGWITSDTATFVYTQLVDLSDGAGYLDTDGDGFIDRGVVYVDIFKKPDSIVCIEPGDNGKVITVTEFEQIDDAWIFDIDWGNDVTGDPVTGFDDSTYITLFGDGYGDGASVETRDMISPVITYASVVPFEEYAGGLDTYDRLFVTFSEEMDINSLKNDTSFVLTSKVAGLVNPTIELSIAPELDNTTNGEFTYRFAINNWGTNPLSGIVVTYPMNVDSLSIDSNAGLSDTHGNVQDNEDNRRSPLSVKAKPVRIKFYSAWGAGGGNDLRNSIIHRYPGPDINSLTSGVVMIVDPESVIGEDQFSDIVVDVVIFDQIGNVVELAQGEAGGIIRSDKIIAVPVIFKVQDDKGETVQRTGISIVWSAKNADQRLVGAGAYKAYIKTSWPGGVTDEVTALIQVRQ